MPSTTIRPLVPGDPGRGCSKRYPIPVSVALRNFYIPTTEKGDVPPTASGEVSVVSPKRIGTATAADVLLAVRTRVEIFTEQSEPSIDSQFLNNVYVVGKGEISVNNTDEAQSASSVSSSDGPEHILFSAEHDSIALNPYWDHLDEIQLFDQSSAGSSKPEGEEKYQNDIYKWEGMYKTLKIRVVAEDKSQSKLMGNDGVVTLAEVPLHPTLLRRIPRGDFNVDRVSDFDAPGSLPPNTILIRHSDGLTRVTPSLYHLLLRRDVISEKDPAKDAAVMEDIIEEKKRERRFDDNVFSVLDAAGSARSGEGAVMAPERSYNIARAKTGGTSSVFDSDNLFDLLGDKNVGRKGRHVSSRVPNKKASSPQGIGHSVHSKDIFDLLDGGGSNKKGHGVTCSARKARSDVVTKSSITLQSQGKILTAEDEVASTPISITAMRQKTQNPLPLQSEVYLNDLRVEIQDLQNLLLEEELGLECDKLFLTSVRSLSRDKGISFCSRRINFCRAKYATLPLCHKFVGEGVQRAKVNSE